MKNLADLTQQEKTDFGSSFDTIIFDLDGVIWNFGEPIIGASEALKSLHEADKKIFFLTNNCSYSRSKILRLLKPQYPQVTLEMVMNSGYILARHLIDIGFKKRIYMIGGSGINEELRLAGIETSGCGPDRVDDLQDIKNIELDEEVGAVVVGIDLHLSMAKLTKAVNYLADPNCLYFTTHMHPHIYLFNKLLPCGGMVVAGLNLATGRQPVLTGKPGQVSTDFILKMGLDLNRTLFVGDMCESDVVLGNKCGMRTLLVLSGTDRLEDVLDRKARDPKDPSLPTYYTDSVTDLIPIVSAAL